jgi:dipeptidyl aminopeptidase/acylaminoacyl peptidase
MISSFLGAEPLLPGDVLKLKDVTEAKISPNGDWIAYTASFTRDANEEPGNNHNELYIISTRSKEIKPLLTGQVRVTSIAWSPDGKTIAYISEGENKKNQVWTISVDEGTSKQISRSKMKVRSYQWHPSGKKIAFIAESPKTAKEEKLKERGYGFIYFEENLKHRNIYLIDLENNEDGIGEQLTEGATAWDFVFSPNGKTIAAALSPENLIDYSYMFKKIYLIDVQSKSKRRLTDNPGKLGNFMFNYAQTHLVYTAAFEQKDHQISQVYVIPVAGGEVTNLTPSNFRGHVKWAAWKDDKTVVYMSNEGLWTTLSTVGIDGKNRQTILNSEQNGIVFEKPDFTSDFKHFALVGSSPKIPGEVFYWDGANKFERMTKVNPWLDEKNLGEQKIINYTSRDGAQIEGILIYPVEYQGGTSYPLVVTVHGGPESNYVNGWLTNYSRPGQVLAGKRYAVFYPNYRSSTGYGLEYAAVGYGDPAGKEFDDIADGIDYLIEQGIADKNRVGLGGGSYGGYASGWFATYYTKYVRAVCMFVGVSDLISRRGTTDIPYEELHVHSGKKLEEMWDISLKRSPLYYAHQSKTATLIFGGADDPRVHPTQSLELFRRMKMNDHPAVRLVQYPGEEHGNKEQPGKIDVLYRILDWYDWYVKDTKPLEGPMPPLDISDKYGLEF